MTDKTTEKFSALSQEPDSIAWVGYACILEVLLYEHAIFIKVQFLMIAKGG